MELKWSNKAVSDLARLHEFLAPKNKTSVAGVVQALVKAPHALLANPRIGEQLHQFEPREVRRILVERRQQRIDVAKDMFVVPDDIDLHNEEIARLFQVAVSR